MLITKQLHIMNKKYYGSQWGPKTVWLPTFFKTSYFVSDRFGGE